MGYTAAETKRFEMTDKIEEPLKKVFDEYKEQSSLRMDSSILDAAGSDLSGAIVNAMEGLTQEEQTRVAFILANDLQVSLVPGYIPDGVLKDRILGNKYG